MIISNSKMKPNSYPLLPKFLCCVYLLFSFNIVAYFNSPINLRLIRLIYDRKATLN